MTSQEFKMLKAKILEMYSAKEITKEEGLTTIKILRKIYGKCLSCSYYDGYPHSRCYNCE